VDGEQKLSGKVGRGGPESGSARLQKESEEERRWLVERRNVSHVIEHGSKLCLAMVASAKPPRPALGSLRGLLRLDALGGMAPARLGKPYDGFVTPAVVLLQTSLLPEFRYD
jgi:hypothetical protein